MQIKLSQPLSGTFEISLVEEQLPQHVITIEPVQCQYDLTNYPDYYHLNLKTKTDVTVTCQRCGQPYSFSYKNHTELALCDNELIAERMMDSLDPIVLITDEIPFESIIADEIQLYLPGKHTDLANCAYQETSA